MVTRGQAIFIEGRLAYRSWKDRQGQKRTTAEIVARELIVLDRSPHGDPDKAGERAAESEAADELSDFPI